MRKSKQITKWEAPNGGGAPLLTMPNVPLPLHKQCPRNIMGATEWRKVCKQCYEDAGDVCEICGQKLSGKLKDIYLLHHSHELYSYDYEAYTATFVRCVCLCPTCHSGFIHSGRALTCYQKYEPLWDKEHMLNIAEHGFQLIDSWNKLHPNDEPLRVYETFNDWLAEPSLHDDLEALMRTYQIKTYSIPNRTDWENAWSKWKLVYDGVEYYGLYASHEEWQAEMDKSGGHTDQVDLFSEESINTMAELDDDLWG